MERGSVGERTQPSFLVVLAIGIAILVALMAGIAADELTGANNAQAQTPGKPSARGGFAAGPATAAFGSELMRALPPGNLVVSPDGVATALAMAGSGAVGTTAEEIAATLRLTSPAAFTAVGDLQKRITREQTIAGQGEPEAPTLDLAAGLFLQEGFPLEQAFVSTLEEHFDAPPQSVDFSGNPSGSVRSINEWISDHTNTLIPQLLAALPETTQLALSSAVYLKASWLYPFNPSENSHALFHEHHHNRGTSAEFMHETELVPYNSGKGYAAVELPYSASTLSLLVVLPRRENIGSFQHGLSPRLLARIIHGLSTRYVRVSLPRFQLRTQVTLNRILEALGMGAAFGEAANFSRITRAEALRIGLVTHAAEFRVEESGTEAAVGTVVGGEFTGSFLAPRAVTFNANRPFLFFLRDDRSGALLLSGRLTDPAAAEA